MEEEEESGGDGESRTKNPSSLFLFLSCVSISHSHFFVTSPRGGKRKIRRRGGKQGAKKLRDPGNPSPNFQIDGPNFLLGVPRPMFTPSPLLFAHVFFNGAHIRLLWKKMRKVGNEQPQQGSAGKTQQSFTTSEEALLSPPFLSAGVHAISQKRRRPPPSNL